MTNITVEKPIEDQEAVQAPKAARKRIVLNAWTATLLLSQLPLVFARDLLGTDITWITPAWIGLAVLLYVITFVWQTLKPLRSYFAIMALVILFAYGLTPFVVQSQIWNGLIDNALPLVSLFAVRILLTIETLIVLGALFMMGLKRKDMFLTIGNMAAPVKGITFPGQKQSLSWVIFGTVMAILLGGLFFTFMISENPDALSSLSAALPWMPLVLVSAVLNAFAEEGMYRAAPLALLLPAVGSRHAVWLTAVWFGLGHYYGGIPSGPFGFVQSGLLGLLLGKAMIDTRGMGWPMIIHIVLDTIIFTFIAATMG